MKFKVTLSHVIDESAEVIVDADDEWAARSQVEAMDDDSEIEWRQESISGACVEEVERVD